MTQLKTPFCVFAGAWNNVIISLYLKWSVQLLIYELLINNELNERKTGVLKSDNTLIVPNNIIRIRNLSLN